MVVDAPARRQHAPEEPLVKRADRQTRLLLTVGFGGLLLLLVAVGLNAISIQRNIQSRNAQIRTDYLRRDHILEQLRSEIYLSGTFARDLLIEPDPMRADFHRNELQRSHTKVEGLVSEYSAILREGERDAFNRFRQENEAFFNTLQPILAWNADERRRLGYSFMQSSLLPRRMTVVHLADQLSEVNEKQLAESSRNIQQLFSRFRDRLTLLLALTFSVGIVLAAITFYRILRLERETAQRLTETVEARGALRDLSSRLLEAQETERRVISRELHDEVGQSLSGLLLGIANLSATISPVAGGEIERELKKLQRLTERTVATVRDMSLLLRPSMLDDLGLLPALQWQAREVSRESGLPVAVNAEPISDKLTDDQKTCIYRLVQEALRNAVRHAHATAVTVGLTEARDRLLLSIEDNGRGFNPEQEKGLGLLGMKERVEHLGGSFAIASKPGRGSQIRVELPLLATQTYIPA